MSSSSLDVTPRNQSASCRAEKWLRGALSRRLWRPGERLPSEGILAEKAGVSRPTVHAVLEALSREGLINPYRKRGWKVSETVSQPRLPLSRTVGVLSTMRDLSTAATGKPASLPIHTYAGLLRSLHGNEWHCLALDPESTRQSDVDNLLSQGLKGLVALFDAAKRPAIQSLLHELQKRSIPIVVHADGLSMPGFDAVISDHVSGARQLTKHLIAQGKRRILRFWDVRPGKPRPGWLGLRDKGYEDACQEAAIEPLPAFEAMFPTGFKGYDTHDDFMIKVHLTKSYLEPFLNTSDPIDSIMLPSDAQVYCVAAALRLMGKAPNLDVVLVGYDNIWRECMEREWDPVRPYATVDKHNQRTGEVLCQVLQERLENQNRPDAIVRSHEPELIVIDEPAAE